MSGLDWVIAIVCSGLGIILGIIRIAQGKRSGAQMLIVSAVCAALGVALNILIAIAKR